MAVVTSSPADQQIAVLSRPQRRNIMKISIIGAGNMSRGIGSRLVAGGHAVTISDVDAGKAKTLASELAAGKGGAKAEAVAADAAFDAQVVVLAVPFSSAREFAVRHADKLAGKIVIDITNPLNDSYDGLVTHPAKSAAEEIAESLPKSRVVKAFNTTFAGTLVSGGVNGHKLDVFVAGDDAEAKKTVIGLIEDGGLRAIDAGKLDRARQLEGLGLLGITLQGPLGTGFMSAWKLVA
jgi:NADPH-dependent F420 reductase